MSTRSNIRVILKEEDRNRDMKFNPEMIEIKNTWGKGQQLETGLWETVNPDGHDTLIVYHHWDGYPEGIGQALLEDYNDYDDTDAGTQAEDDYYDYNGEQESGGSFYSKPGVDYTVGGDDDYLTAVPVSKTAGDGLPDLFGGSSVGTRNSGESDFSSIFNSAGRTQNASGKTDPLSDEGSYPALFTSNRPARRQPPAAPKFDNDEDTIFGRFSANVERNVDDGYGGLSSSRGRDRSERSPRNR